MRKPSLVSRIISYVALWDTCCSAFCSYKR